MNGFLDTNIIVDIIRKYPPALDWYNQRAVYGISLIVYMEVIEGARSKKAYLEAARLLNTFERVLLSEDDQQWAIVQQSQYHLSYSVEFADCLIASAAHRLALPLYTGNLKHMRPLLQNLAVKPY